MKEFPKHYYAPISGLYLTNEKQGKYSSLFRIYDKNMRFIRGQTWRPFTYEVPYMGCVLQVIFDQNETGIKLYDSKK